MNELTTRSASILLLTSLAVSLSACIPVCGNCNQTTHPEIAPVTMTDPYVREAEIKPLHIR